MGEVAINDIHASEVILRLVMAPDPAAKMQWLVSHVSNQVSGEWMLCAAVLGEAINNLADPRYAVDAKLWFLEDCDLPDEGDLGLTFDMVCSVLELDHSAVLRAVNTSLQRKAQERRDIIQGRRRTKLKRRRYIQNGKAAR